LIISLTDEQENFDEDDGTVAMGEEELYTTTETFFVKLAPN